VSFVSYRAWCTSLAPEHAVGQDRRCRSRDSGCPQRAWRRRLLAAHPIDSDTFQEIGHRLPAPYDLDLDLAFWRPDPEPLRDLERPPEDERPDDEPLRLRLEPVERPRAEVPLLFGFDPPERPPPEFPPLEVVCGE
jgi:hypothetical protein